MRDSLKMSVVRGLNSIFKYGHPVIDENHDQIVITAVVEGSEHVTHRETIFINYLDRITRVIDSTIEAFTLLWGA